MNKKRISAAALALAMTASVSVSALATETDGAVDGVRLPETVSNEYGIALISAENGDSQHQAVAGVVVIGGSDRVVNDGVETEVPEGGTLVITPDGSAVDSGFGVDAEFDAGFSVDAEVIPEHYTGIVTLDGEDITSVNYAKTTEGDWEVIDNYINIEDLPGAPAGYIPMRLLCQAAGGAASFYKEYRRSMFYINDTIIYTNFEDNTVYVMDDDFNEVLQEGVTCYLNGGVTYLPVSFIATLPRLTVDSYTFDGQEVFDITIEPEGTAMDQLANEVYNGVDSPASTVLDKDTVLALTEEDFSLYFEEFSGLMAMMSAQSNVVVIGKYAEGVDKDAAKTALQKIQQFMIDSNTFYAEPLALAQAGQIVESNDGAYVMLIISGNNEAGITLFRDGVIGLDQANSGIMPR